MKTPTFIDISIFFACRSTTMKLIPPPLRTIARSLGSPQGLVLIAGLCLVLSAPLAQAQTEPEQVEPSVQDRKSAWKVHAVRANRPLYRRGGEILVQYKPGATREALNTGALTPMIQVTRASRGEMEAVIFDEDKIDFTTLREQLLATPGVLRAEPNVLFSTQSDESPFVGGDLTSNQWHLESTPGHSRLTALSRTLLPIDRAIRIGVIDTGVDYAHTEFKGRTLPGVNLISHPLPDEDPESEVDLNGHGTKVAGIIAAADDDKGVVGINPRAEICSIKAFNRDGDGYLGDIVAGIDWAIDNRIQVLNMSFGTYEHSEILGEAIVRARNAGILLIAAAGNDAAETAMYPAAFPGVLSVGAYDKRGQTSAFSNWGPGVDFHAPGDQVLTTDLWRGGYYPYTTFHGTSGAAAYVTGVASLLMEHGTSTGSVADLLRQNVVAHDNEAHARQADLWLNGRLILSRLLDEPYSELTIVSFKTDRSIFKHEDAVSVTYEVQNTGTLNTADTQAWLTVREGETSRPVTLANVPGLAPGQRHEATTVIPASRLLGTADLESHRLRIELAIGDFPQASHPHRRLLISEAPRTAIRVPALWASPLDFNDTNADRTFHATVENAGREAVDNLVARVYAVPAVHEGVVKAPKIDLGTVEIGTLASGQIKRLSLPLTDFTPPEQNMTFWLDIEREGQALTQRLQGYRYAGSQSTAKPEYAEWVHKDIADEAIKLLESQGIIIPDLQNPQYRGTPSGSYPWPTVGGLPTGFWWNTGYWSDNWLTTDSEGLSAWSGLALGDLTLVDGAYDCDFVDIAFGYSVEDTFDSHFWIVDNHDDDGLDSSGTNHHSALTKLRALLYGNGTVNCTDGCPGASPTPSGLLLNYGAIDHYLQGHKQAAWWFVGHAVHLIGDLSVPSHVDNENSHGVYGATYHNWMDDGANSLWSHVQAKQQGGYVDPYETAAAGDPLRYLAYTTAQLGNSFPWASTTLATTFGAGGNRTAGGNTPHYDAKMTALFAQLDPRPTAEWHVQKDEIFDYKWWDYGCDLVDWVGVSEYHEDCYDGDGHADWDNTDDGGTNVDGDLYRIGRVNYPYAIRAAAGLIYYFAVQTGQISQDTLYVTTVADGGPGSLRQAIADAPSGYTIKFAESLDGQTIGLGSLGELVIDKDLTIDASALPNGLIINTNPLSPALNPGSRIFLIGSGATATLKGLRITLGGASVDHGGAIRNNGTLTLEDCWVYSNSSNVQGGAIYNYFGTLNIYRSTLNGNNTLGNGSAIWAAGATTYIENSTILSNYAFGAYGAIVNENGTLTVVNSTVVENGAIGGGSLGGGVIHLQFGQASTLIENSIVAMNSADSAPDIYKNGGTVATAGANLIGNNSTVSVEFPAGPLVGTTASPLDPLLAELAFNDRGTLSMAPLVGSPAIDAAIATGSSPGTDQRGADRPGGLDDDLGAVELAECGNGVLGVGETCDDGNSVGGDCCSATCTFEMSGSVCDIDGSVCTEDTCDGAGFCSAGAPLICDDSNVCTDDLCDAVTGCQNTINAVTSCDDGNSCTTTDTCSSGICAGSPPELPTMSPLLTMQGDSLNWTPGAGGYDVVSGDLDMLRAIGGDFSIATTECLANDELMSTLDDASVPLPGDTAFYVVRPTNCSGSGSYDTSDDSLVAGRDAGIEAAPITCSTSCTRGLCAVGPPLDPECDECTALICDIDSYCCDTEWDDICVGRARTDCGNLTCGESAGTCTHPVCTEGAPLFAGCDDPPISPSCTDAICAIDSTCCSDDWDATCVQMVDSVCGYTCDGVLAKTVFVSSSTQAGNLGGLAGGDAICQGLADAASLGGTYMAWLSDSTESPATRFVPWDGPYERTDGVRIADSWADLLDGTLAAPISVTETGAVVSGQTVQTGTDSQGFGVVTAPGPYCMDWTSGAGAGVATIVRGNAGGTGTNWTNGGTAGCANVIRIYCFEQ